MELKTAQLLWQCSFKLVKICFKQRAYGGNREISMTPGNQCRLSKLNLVIYNWAIFLLNPSKRKDQNGEVLAQICAKYSSRVCLILVLIRFEIVNHCTHLPRKLLIKGKISRSTPTKSTPVKQHLQEMSDSQISSRCYRLWQKQTTQSLGIWAGEASNIWGKKQDNLDQYLDTDNLPIGRWPPR